MGNKRNASRFMPRFTFGGLSQASAQQAKIEADKQA